MAHVHLVHEGFAVIQVQVGDVQGGILRHGHFPFLLQGGELIFWQGIGDIDIPPEICKRREAPSPMIFTDLRLNPDLSPGQCGLGAKSNCGPFCQLFSINGPEPAVFCAGKPRASSAACSFSEAGLMIEVPSFARM